MPSYQSTGSRDPIWTQVACDPEDGLATVTMNERYQGASNQFSENGPITNFPKGKQQKKGLNVMSAAVFIVGEMAGSGVLALPRAIVNSGWIGLVLVVVFCFNAGYGGMRLGSCWEILEERFPEHRTKTRNPYATIAYRAVGKWGSIIVSGCIQFTLFGAGIVYLLLASQITQELLSDVLPQIKFCLWYVLIALILTPAMWLGSPKDFWAVGVGATLTTSCACVLIFTQICMDGLTAVEPVRHITHNFHDFFLSFGTLLFAFGGASTFPTIQNDMEKKEKFSSSVGIGFAIILILYLPVTAGGYFIYGEDVEPNVAMSLTRTSLVTLANVLMAIHLVLAFLIVINPVCQELEEIFRVPHEYHWKRSVLRTCMMAVMLFVGETIPRFGKILSLVGGSTVTLLTFVFPPYFYMKLCSQKDLAWPERSIPLYKKVYMWELIFIGLFGGTAATYSAIIDIFGVGSITKPCYWS